MIKTNRNQILTLLAAIGLASAAPALAGPNDYFSGNGPILPGAVGQEQDDTPKKGLFGNGPSSSSNAQAAPANGPSTVPGAGFDNTGDEKRMQKKYKASIARMKDLISKGESMMKSAPNKEDKQYKKGKILKETGEKHLADMQANSPFNVDIADEKKKDSK